MRLINTSTQLFEEFFTRSTIPKYVILSHTWEADQEVSYKEMSDPATVSHKNGYKKITKTCQLASEARIPYAWIDTCCIDKSSSAELTEAINSMYRWYEQAEMCYVCLSDLMAAVPLEEALPQCRWFKRGWTLQELIASSNQRFYSQDWHFIGAKKDLITPLSQVTRIDARVLRKERHLSTVPVAQKMSWACGRKTTRIEDIAYCLLGIFDINMPLLYGEGKKAFRRLQEEIIRSTSDLSIFAWKLPSTSDAAEEERPRMVCSIFAGTPDVFDHCTSLENYHHNPQEISVTNIGIKLIFADFLKLTRTTNGYVLSLECRTPDHMTFGIKLRKCGPEQFVREDPWSCNARFHPQPRNAPTQRCVLTNLPHSESGKDESHLDSNFLDMNVFIPQTRTHVLQIKLPRGFYIDDPWPQARFDYEDQLFFVSGTMWSDICFSKLSMYSDLCEFPAWVKHSDKLHIQCKFWFSTTGWSNLDPSGLQYTILDLTTHHTALAELQREIPSLEHHPGRVLDYLRFHDIPRTRSVSTKLRTTNLVMVVSVVPTLVVNSSICANQFWKMDISYEVFRAEDVTESPAQLQWNPW